MTEKWNLPPEPVPAWLDPAAEVKHDASKLPESEFIVLCTDALLRLGCSVPGALGVVANSLNETGHGRYYRAWNLGGWKITKGGAKSYREKHGSSAPWWRAPGNKAPDATPEDFKGGDPPWCYYWGFASVGDYLARWLAQFVPKPAPGAPSREGQKHGTADYRLAGERFWRDDPAWFAAMVAAGYKGERTRRKPDRAIAEHRELVDLAATRWAQSKLGVVADGVWGPKSRTACGEFQSHRGLPVTAEADATTLAALAALVPRSTPPQPSQV